MPTITLPPKQQYGHAGNASHANRAKLKDSHLVFNQKCSTDSISNIPGINFKVNQCRWDYLPIPNGRWEEAERVLWRISKLQSRNSPGTQNASQNDSICQNTWLFLKAADISCKIFRGNLTGKIPLHQVHIHLHSLPIPNKRERVRGDILWSLLVWKSCFRFVITVQDLLNSCS